MSIQDSGQITFKAGTTLTAGLRVFFKAGSATDPLEVAVAGNGATDPFIGTVRNAVFTVGEYVTVLLNGKEGTQSMIAAGAISAQDAVYRADGGKVDNVVNGAIIGYALRSASADGELVEVLLKSGV